MAPRRNANPVLRAVAVASVVLGAVLVVGALFADQLSLSDVGGRGGDGLGYTQLLAVIVGLVLLLGGAAWLVQPPAGRDAADEGAE